MANSASEQLHGSLKAGAHCETLASFEQWINQKPTSDTVRAMARAAGPVFCVSNLGKIEFPNLSNAFLLPKELTALVTAHNLYPHHDTLMAVAMTYRDTLQISF